MVAVSVGMLDTGFDCREVLHLVMCRRVRSPILYQQMRGRGTRTAPHIGKKQFVIYDFFRNHEYFNDSDTDIFAAHGGGHARTGGGPSAGRPPDESHRTRPRRRMARGRHLRRSRPRRRARRQARLRHRLGAGSPTRTPIDDPLIRKVRADEPLDDAEEDGSSPSASTSRSTTSTRTTSAAPTASRAAT